jgi:hypothetical protein
LKANISVDSVEERWVRWGGVGKRIAVIAAMLLFSSSAIAQIIRGREAGHRKLDERRSSTEPHGLIDFALLLAL